MKNVFQKINKSLLFVIISSGVVLRLIQYFFNRGLWMDEASLAINIIEPSISLFKPLENLQVAPILFLLIERLSYYLLGPSEMALRLFPLICSLASIPFAFLFFRNMCKDKSIVYIALGLFSLSPSLIYYSSEVKQYAIDVLIILVLFYLATSNLSSYKKNILLLFVGSVSIFLSNISPLLFVVIGLYFLYTQLREKKIDYMFLVVGFVWSILFVVYYAFFIHGHSARVFMLQFWTKSFMPLSPFSNEFLEFFIKKVGYSLKTIFIYTKVNNVFLLVLITSLLALGTWMVSKTKSIKTIGFIFLPIIIHFLISAFKLYPYHLRMVLYLVPLYILIFSFGLNTIYKMIQRKIPQQLAMVLVMLVFIAFSIENAKLFPYKRMESRKALQYVYNNIKHGEQFYVNWDFDSSLRYYIKSGQIPFEIDYIEGKLEESCEGYENALSKLKGDVWIVTTHVQGSGMDCLMQFLENNGKLLDEYKDFRVVAALYRL